MPPFRCRRPCPDGTYQPAAGQCSCRACASAIISGDGTSCSASLRPHADSILLNALALSSGSGRRAAPGNVQPCRTLFSELAVILPLPPYHSSF